MKEITSSLRIFLLTIEIESFSSFIFAFAFYHSSIFFFPFLDPWSDTSGNDSSSWNFSRNKGNKSTWSFDLVFSFLESEYSVSINIFYRLILSNGIETKEHEFGRVLIFNERKAEEIDSIRNWWRDDKRKLKRFLIHPFTSLWICSLNNNIHFYKTVYRSVL